ncbi:Homeobox-leucine zipper protein HDG1 [Hibiscus syriacus]|uniref:Homeobox-leucine zipper protein HDG1 n=1 Tax=Hibiscus syriacus TaxID=106335 RepID=A0A6A2XAN2_HIBSY|nr:Homeobox-leucine zipper protein HDG1 [Hibiscus syriacus]
MDGYESMSSSDNFEFVSGDDQDGLRRTAENNLLKQAMTTPVCNSCGGPAVPGEISYEQYQLRIENDRLKDEFSGICALSNKFLVQALQFRRLKLVYVRGSALVEALMDANCWSEMFPCMISTAATIDVLCGGTGGTRDNELLMDSEFQVLSPLVPVRRVRFIRFCKQHSEGVWAVIDVSNDVSQGAADTQMFPNCRKLPSGCLIQDVDNKCSKVTWIEHSEYNDGSVHHLLRPLLSSGFGFGAHRWLATLQRHCDYMAILMNNSPDGKKSMLKLARRMTDNFCAGVCASSIHKWDKLSVGNVGEDVRVITRKNLNDPGEPHGVVLCAATSVWMPITRERLFDFLRDERMRSEWDILSHVGPIQEMVHIAKGMEHGNCVSLLRGSISFHSRDFSHSNYLLGCGVPLQAINANENNMLNRILHRVIVADEATPTDLW